MKSKVLLFLLSFIVNVSGMDKPYLSDVILKKPKITYTIKCPKLDCCIFLTNRDRQGLASLILKHIYTQHSNPELYKDFEKYIKQNSKLTKKRKFLKIQCLYCNGKLVEKDISQLTKVCVTHQFTKHNETGLQNMLEYVCQEAQKQEIQRKS